MHPELVTESEDEEVPTLYLCKDCLADKRDSKTGNIIKPERSIANGVDFGYYRRLELTPLNFHEQMVVSLNRLYAAVLKVSVNTSGRVNHNTKNRIRTHAVMFAHDAAKVLSQYFAEIDDLTSLENLTKDLMVHLIDGKGRCDFLAQRILGSPSVFCRWWNLVSYLRVLKVTSKHFGHLCIPAASAVKARCEEAEKNIIGSAEKIKDQATVSMEANIGSDVAEAQTKYVRDAEESDFEHDLEAEICEEVPVQVSYVQNDPLKEAKKDDRAVTRAYLQSIAKLAGLEKEEIAQAPVDPDEADEGHICRTKMTNLCNLS